MRRALILTAVLALLALCLLPAASAVIVATADWVTYETTWLYGEASAAEGLTARLRTTLRSSMLWDSTLDVATGGSVTEYRFGGVESNYDMQYGVDFDSMPQRYNYNTSFDDDPQGLARAYRELFDATPAGGESQKTVRLADYVNYYPLDITIRLPDTVLYLEHGYVEPSPDAPRGSEDYAAWRLGEYFRIPVGDAELNVTLSRAESGNLRSAGYDSAEWYFYAATYSTVTPDAAYFAFNAQLGDGGTVDTSLIENGFGIYRLPYTTGEGARALVDELDTVYALDPEVCVRGLYSSPDGERLLLFTVDAGVCYLTVLDAEGEELQRIALCEPSENTQVWNVFDYGDFLAVWLSQDELAVVEADGGEYRLAMRAKTDFGDAPIYLSTSAVMAWDGERLAVSDFLGDAVLDRPNAFCSVYVAVFDETGLASLTTHLSSLDAGNDSMMLCQRTYNEPLTLTWK